MICGFTGTRKGMSNEQKNVFTYLLLQLNCTELHHGDCVGADEQAHHIAKKLGIKVVVHPPVNQEYRAFCKGDVILSPDEYLKRNKDIVDVCDVLIATPLQKYEILRSGTWSTIRYSKSKKKRTYIILRDGNVVVY